MPLWLNKPGDRSGEEVGSETGGRGGWGGMDGMRDGGKMGRIGRIGRIGRMGRMDGMDGMGRGNWIEEVVGLVWRACGERAGRRTPCAERAVMLPAVQSLRRTCSDGLVRRACRRTPCAGRAVMLPAVRVHVSLLLRQRGRWVRGRRGRQPWRLLFRAG
jgi:hypothetical protein